MTLWRRSEAGRRAVTCKTTVHRQIPQATALSLDRICSVRTLSGAQKHKQSQSHLNKQRDKHSTQLDRPVRRPPTADRKPGNQGSGLTVDGPGGAPNLLPRDLLCVAASHCHPPPPYHCRHHSAPPLLAWICLVALLRVFAESRRLQPLLFLDAGGWGSLIGRPRI